MIHNGKQYILTEGKGNPCSGCVLSDLCDILADDLDMIEYELCATEEDFESFENPVYEEVKEMQDED